MFTRQLQHARPSAGKLTIRAKALAVELSQAVGFKVSFDEYDDKDTSAFCSVCKDGRVFDLVVPNLAVNWTLRDKTAHRGYSYV
jgi:hypothetical protein